MFFELEVIWAMVRTLRGRLAEARAVSDAGYSTEAVVVTALLVTLAVAAVAIIADQGAGQGQLHQYRQLRMVDRLSRMASRVAAGGQLEDTPALSARHRERRTGRGHAAPSACSSWP